MLKLTGEVQALKIKVCVHVLLVLYPCSLRFVQIAQASGDTSSLEADVAAEQYVYFLLRVCLSKLTCAQ